MVAKQIKFMAIFLIISVMLLTVFVHVSFGDGGIVVPYIYQNMKEPTQTAVIVFNGSYEQIVLQPTVSRLFPSFGWVIPVPAYPIIKKVNDRYYGYYDVFVQLSDSTLPIIISAPPSVPQMLFHFNLNSNYYSSKVMNSATRVLEQKAVGIYNVTLLSSNNSSSLYDWLNKNNFSFIDKEQTKSVLSDYINKKWYFIAIKISNTSSAENYENRYYPAGHSHKDNFYYPLQPIYIGFNSSSITYPLKISSLNGDKSLVLLYVLAKYKTMVKNYKDFVLKYAGWSNVIEYICSEFHQKIFSLPNGKNCSYYKHYFLTKLEANIPASNMTSDVMIVPAPNNNSYHRTIVESDYYQQFFLSIIYTFLFVMICWGALIGYYFLNNRYFKAKSKYHISHRRLLIYAIIIGIAVYLPYFSHYFILLAIPGQIIFYLLALLTSEIMMNFFDSGINSGIGNLIFDIIIGLVFILFSLVVSFLFEIFILHLFSVLVVAIYNKISRKKAKKIHKKEIAKQKKHLREKANKG